MLFFKKGASYQAARPPISWSPQSSLQHSSPVSHFSRPPFPSQFSRVRSRARTPRRDEMQKREAHVAPSKPSSYIRLRAVRVRSNASIYTHTHIYIYMFSVLLIESKVDWINYTSGFRRSWKIEIARYVPVDSWKMKVKEKCWYLLYFDGEYRP